MKVYVDKNELDDRMAVLDTINWDKQDVYVLIDNTGKRKEGLHFFDLADHDKQVRKEVKEEIQKWIKTRLNDYRFEGHISTPETDELAAILYKIKEIEND